MFKRKRNAMKFNIHHPMKADKGKRERERRKNEINTINEKHNMLKFF